MKRLLKTLVFASLLLFISCGNNPEKSRLYYDKGMDYLYHSQFEEAIEYFDKAIKFNDKNHEAYFSSNNLSIDFPPTPGIKPSGT